MQLDRQDQLRLLKLDDMRNNSFKIDDAVANADVAFRGKPGGDAADAGVTADGVVRDTEDGVIMNVGAGSTGHRV